MDNAPFLCLWILYSVFPCHFPTPTRFHFLCNILSAVGSLHFHHPCPDTLGAQTNYLRWFTRSVPSASLDIYGLLTQSRPDHLFWSRLLSLEVGWWSCWDKLNLAGESTTKSRIPISLLQPSIKKWTVCTTHVVTYLFKFPAPIYAISQTLRRPFSTLPDRGYH